MRFSEIVMHDRGHGDRGSPSFYVEHAELPFELPEKWRAVVVDDNFR